MATFSHQEGTAIVFADTTYSATNSGLTRTDQIDLTGITDGSARQSVKADLTASRAPAYAVRVGIEFQTAPTAGNAVDFYWSSSVSATAGTGNDGGASGSDAAYKAAEESEWAKQLTYLGSLIATNDGNTTPQYQTVGYFTPPHRYGQVIVVNDSGQSFNTTDAVEMFVALIPIVHDIT